LTVAAPVAANDAYNARKDVTLNVAAAGVLANDTNPYGAALTAVLVSGPAHGTLTLATNGAFSYTPAAGYTGTDSFTYQASGGGTFSNVATVAFTVTAPTLSINDVRANTSGVGTNFTFTVTLSSPISQTVTVAYATANGTASAMTD